MNTNSESSVNISFHARNSTAASVSPGVTRDSFSLQIGDYGEHASIWLFINPWIAKRIIDALTPYASSEQPPEPEAVENVEQEVEL